MSQSRGVVSLDYEYFGACARPIVCGNRISTTFRFRTDSAEFDWRAVRDIDRLVDFLKAVLGRNVLIAGSPTRKDRPRQYPIVARPRQACC
jgi:hypothetical protein